MALISTEEKFVLWRTSLDDVAPTLGAGRGPAADAVLAAGAAVHKAVPGPDLGQGPAVSTAPGPGLVASPGPGLGESLTPSPQQSPAPGSQSLVLVHVRRSHAVAPPAASPALAPMHANLAPRVAPKRSRRGIPGAAPRRSQSVRSPAAALLLQGRTEMETGPSPLLVRRPLKRTAVSRSRPASVLRLALLHVRSLVPALGLLLKTSVTQVGLHGRNMSCTVQC